MVQKLVAKIGPSILNADLSHLHDESVRLLNSGADYLHLDVMDGHFVPNLTFGHPLVKCLRNKIKHAFFEVHMMVSKPEQWIEPMADAGVNQYTFHVEPVEDVLLVCRKVREAGMKVGVALKPGTPVDIVVNYIDQADMVLVMTVEPGFGGQKFMAPMMEKVAWLRKNYPTLDIEVDGGVGPSTVQACAEFHFLKSSLEGEAASLLKNVALTESSFISAWDRLINRFENPRAITQAELKLLFAIPQMKDGSVTSLKLIRNNVVERIAALENLGRFPNLTAAPANVIDSSIGVSDMLVFHILQKLDSESRFAWELQLGNATEYPHFSKLLSFMDSRIRALEAVQRNEEKKPKIETARSHVVSSVNSCPLCGHSVNTCSSSFSCAQCKVKHHTLLHLGKSEKSAGEQFEKGKNESLNVSEHQPDPSKTAQLLHSLPAFVEPNHVLLATARVIVTSDSGRSVKVRALLDQGSTWTLMTNELADALQVRTTQSDSIKLFGLGNVSAGEANCIVPVKIESRLDRRPFFLIDALVTEYLTDYVTTVSSHMLLEPHLRDLDLADDDVQGPGRIHLLIGADLYGSILRVGLKKGRPGYLIAQNTTFGWILSGKTFSSKSKTKVVKDAAVHHCISNVELNDSIQKFWEVEELPHTSPLTQKELECEAYFVESHSRTEDGRYVVRLPFKSGPPIDIGKSLKTAEKSLLTLPRKFNRSPGVFEQYDAFLSDYENKDHMTRVTEKLCEMSQVVYLPHHPVVREHSSTTKLRVVFNASSKTSNFTSLNNHLHIGPKLQTGIFDVLLQWRMSRYVYAADIAQMYWQILVHESDRDYQRILWFSPPNPDLIAFRLNTVTYGTSSAPYLALRVLQQLVKDEGAGFPLASEVLARQIYIDDCLFGTGSKEEIIRIREEIKALLKKGGFPLPKRASNSVSLLEDIDPTDHGLAIEKPLKEDESLKVLGIAWIPSQDNFQYQIKSFETSVVTKRSVLSVIARLYDPLGWVSPVVIIAKMFMQKLWLKSFSWDESLPRDLTEFWQSFCEELPKLGQCSIPRWTGQGVEVIDASLQGFSDASNTAYAAVVYLRLVLGSGEAQISE